MKYAARNIMSLLMGLFILISTIGINIAIYSCSGCHHEVHEIASVLIEEEPCLCGSSCSCCSAEHQHHPSENTDAKHIYNKLDITALTEQHEPDFVLFPVLFIQHVVLYFDIEQPLVKLFKSTIDPPPGGRLLLVLISILRL